MRQEVEDTGRDATLVEDAAWIRVMGTPILEALPSGGAPYEQVDPFILVHEGRFRLTPEMTAKDTKHPHRGFDNLWYALQGSISTGHSTGPGGAMERARLTEGSLLALRAGRGVWHAEALGEDEIGEGLADTEFRGVLFWVNLARKDKDVEPSAQVLQPEQIPVRHEGDATVRVLVGEGSPVRLGAPGLILDIELPTGGEVTTAVPPEFQGFAYLLEGEAAFGANRRRAKQLAYNEEQGITPETIVKGVSDIAEFLSLEAPHVPSRRRRGKREVEGMSREELERLIVDLEGEMFTAAEELRFEYAAKLRDEIKELRRELLAFAGAQS